MDKVTKVADGQDQAAPSGPISKIECYGPRQSRIGATENQNAWQQTEKSLSRALPEGRHGLKSCRLVCARG
jgi:hypothetical protein